MLDGIKAGFTPNPDIMCNQEIKFKLFLETALENGADYIATGHYARVKNGRLLKAKDNNKDQTYFLHRVDSSALAKTLFPLGELTKPEVRKIAKKAGLTTAAKKESMGICFVGKVGIKEFLEQYIAQKPGKIVDQKGKVVGRHEGVFFYTIGQRHGLDVGGGLPYYVVGKDMKKNEVHVTRDLQDKMLWSKEIKLASSHWINEEPKPNQKTTVRIRHMAKLVPVKLLSKSSNSEWVAELDEDVRALTPGQSAVFYSGNQVLGGGIVI
jgi:tRNA-specific 2-thiouridylase